MNYRSCCRHFTVAFIRGIIPLLLFAANTHLSANELKIGVDDKYWATKLEVSQKIAYGKIFFALHEFYEAKQRYPSEEEGLQELTKSGEHGSLLDRQYLKDPWRRPYIYRLIDGKPKIYSRGRTGKEQIDLEKLLDN